MNPSDQPHEVDPALRETEALLRGMKPATPQIDWSAIREACSTSEQQVTPEGSSVVPPLAPVRWTPLVASWTCGAAVGAVLMLIAVRNLPIRVDSTPTAIAAVDSDPKTVESDDAKSIASDAESRLRSASMAPLGSSAMTGEFIDSLNLSSDLGWGSDRPFSARMSFVRNGRLVASQQADTSLRIKSAEIRSPGSTEWSPPSESMPSVDGETTLPNRAQLMREYLQQQVH